MGQTERDPASRPCLKATALSKAAMQTAARAIQLAEVAAASAREAAKDTGVGPGAEMQMTETRFYMEALKDALLDAYSAVPVETRERLSKCRAVISPDELIDLIDLLAPVGRAGN